MSIPTQTEMFRHVLEQFADEKDHSRRQAKDKISHVFNLTKEEKSYKTSSGVPVYESRVGWAVSHLHKAGYLQRVSRGIYRITESGKAALSNSPSYASFYQGMNRDQAWSLTENKLSGESEGVKDISPDEMISLGVDNLNEQLTHDLMDAIMEIPGREGDAFFEKIVTDLLVHIGYGEGKVTPSTNDGGIDGIITTDALGFDPIYIQAKRYAQDNIISRPAIQAFAGALGSITRGVFITTSSFSDAAIKSAREYPHASLVLIDGERLTRLMIEYDLGVTTDKVIKLKHLDSDFFSQDE